MPEESEIFGRAPDGTDVRRFRISGGPVTATVMTWGASLVDFRMDGVENALVLGASDFAAYLGPMRYFGAIVGPVANRIAGGRMIVDGQTCLLDKNEAGRTTLHGGRHGFSERNWTILDVGMADVTLGLRHAHGVGGFPGNIDLRVRYSLESDGALTIEIEGEADRPTVLAPAFHGYWTLDGRTDLSAHTLTVDANEYTPVDEAQIPMGGPVPVEGTSFDYRFARVPDPALDHNFCLSRSRDGMRDACAIEGGGLRLSVETTEVGLQVYSGGGLDTAPFVGLHGAPYGSNAGLAIEPQYWPDSPNRPDFPSPALMPGQRYRQVSRFTLCRC